MKKTFKFIFLVLLTMVFTKCSVYTNTYSDYDRSVDFKAYKTFAWLPDSGAVAKKDGAGNLYDNDIIRNNTKNYITHCLGERGYMVQVDTPDVLVQLILLNEKKERIVTYSGSPYSYYHYNRYYYPYYYPYSNYYTYYDWGYQNYYYGRTATTGKQEYVKGTITINIYDRKLKKLVWTGSAEGDIYDTAYIQADVHPAIHRTMKKYPVKPLDKKKEIKWKNYQNGENILYPILTESSK